MKFTMKLTFLLFLTLLMSCSADDENNDQQQQQTENDLERIQGQWVRVGGNNPVNNGMIVNVDNNEGIVVDHDQTGFEIGDVKWKNIVPQDEPYYRYEELGSDSNYYPASFVIGPYDTLRISVDNAPGEGSSQKWVR